MKVGGWVVVQASMVDEAKMVGWAVVKPELTALVAGGVVMLGWMEMMGVDLEVVLG